MISAAMRQQLNLAKYCKASQLYKHFQLPPGVRFTQSFRQTASPILRTTASIGVLLAITGYHLDKNPIRLESELAPQTLDYHLPGELELSTQELVDDDDEKVQGLASFQKLSFGTIAGICTGVFVKKGLSLIAFLFGGGFVFLQYLHSRSLIRIDWKNWSDRYESRLRSSKAGHGGIQKKGITVRFMDFLTSDFQYRSTFLVGFALGLRIG